MRIKTGVNALGLPIGQYHHKAKLSDDEVALLYQMFEDADDLKLAGLPYTNDSQLAQKFEVSKGSISQIRRGLRRAQSVVRYK